MRILHIGSTYPPQIVGGAEKVAAMLAEGQAARGHQVASAYLGLPGEHAGWRHGVEVLPQRNRNLLPIDRVFAAPRPMRTANKVAQLVNPRSVADFAGAIADWRPDIVHTHSMVELPPAIWRAAGAGGARLVHTLHDYDLLCSRASLFRDGAACATRHVSCRITGGWKRRFAARIDAVAAVSAPVLAEHRRHGLFGTLNDGRARVIWNAVDLPAAPDRPRRGGDIVFGFLGRLVPEKGIVPLLAACRLLPRTGWRLNVAGRAQEGDEAYRRLAFGMPVQFLGFVDAAAFLDTIDVLVVPSIWREPFGLTVVEAFARGVPVIGTRIGAIAELVGAIGEDWLVPPDDPDALAERMRQAIEQGHGPLPAPPAFDTVLSRVTPARMLDGYEALYERVLGDAA